MKSTSDFFVICLGGSAGGLEAYLDILRSMPGDSGMAFVVAPHRGIEEPERLGQILASATSMPVVDAQNGMEIKPDHVFIMPPRREMTLEDGTFRLGASAYPEGWPKTINIFLYSLAAAKHGRAIAVILSGLDADGSAALKSIKSAGGVTFAQANAAFDSMPKNAVATGHVDFVLPSKEIPRALLKLTGYEKQN